MSELEMTAKVTFDINQRGHYFNNEGHTKDNQGNKFYYKMEIFLYRLDSKKEDKADQLVND